ncbi:type II inositol-1,4,5-trisphosphate 5-phosphatase [Xylaria sp. CBS 124048]|nr:type II inositol-1,4,5-trisphosphate 5-phosphatase [Xylaria sp. CBS 124048]
MSSTEYDHDRDPSAPSAVDPVDTTDPASTTHYSLSRAVNARRSEYTRPHRIRVKVGTWNVAGCPGTDKDLASWFVDGDGLEPRLSMALENLNLSEESIEASEGDATPDHSVRSEYQAGASVDSHSESGSNIEEPPIRVLGGDNRIGLYVLGLQEIVNLNYVHQSLYSDPSIVAKWQDALEKALPRDYKLVASQQLVGLLLLIYASPEVAATISNESTLPIGTGVFGYMGNKGAVVSRLLLGETTRLVFANCHLASGHDQTGLERRCWDYNKIMTQTKFSPIVHSGVMEEEGDQIGDEDFAFFFGDLNFRLDGLPGRDIRHLLTLHAQGLYGNYSNHSQPLGEDSVFVIHDSADSNSDGTSTPTTISREVSFDHNESDESSEELPGPDEFVLDPHDDPASLQATLDSLLPHDQLRRVMRDEKAFHEGWREGSIEFLPTYKYDVGTVGLFDTSEKKRAPSWCDRILYRTRKDLEKYEKKQRDRIDAQKKDEDMKRRGIDQAADDESVLFDYDPTTDSSSETLAPADSVIYDYDEYDEENDTEQATQDGSVDQVTLDLYTSHQRIMSSDHKPLVAVFTLDYKAIVPELKAKVHAEVARELDRFENEGRPCITIVSDGKESAGPDRDDDSVGFDFGDVAFMRKKARYLTIANTGRVSAKLSFVAATDIEDDARPKKSQWVKVKFVHSMDEYGETNENRLNSEISLEPGETVSAVVEVEVRDLKQLQSLNEEPASLENVLVLRVVGGRDHFIPIHAAWKPSCFGRSLEELLRIPKGGIVALMQQRPEIGSIPYSLDVQRSSPTELFKLIEAIESLTERAIADANMIDDVQIPRDKAGWPFDKHTWQTNKDDDFAVLRGAIIEALENDRPVLEALKADVPAIKRLEIVSESLLLFLESMPGGIIAPSLWARIEQALPQLASTKTTAEAEDINSSVLDILSTSPYHNISFVFLTSMLARVAGELLPLSKDELALVSNRRPASMSRRSLSFRRNTESAVNEGAIQRRLAWERRAAEIFGVVICRAAAPANVREKKATEEKMRGAIEVFMRRDK